MGRSPQPEATPKMPEPVRVPSPTDPDLMASMRKRMATDVQTRKGRASTDLTPSSDGAFARTTLG